MKNDLGFPQLVLVAKKALSSSWERFSSVPPCMCNALHVYRDEDQNKSDAL